MNPLPPVSRIRNASAHFSLLLNFTTGMEKNEVDRPHHNLTIGSIGTTGMRRNSGSQDCPRAQPNVQTRSRELSGGSQLGKRRRSELSQPYTAYFRRRMRQRERDCQMPGREILFCKPSPVEHW